MASEKPLKYFIYCILNNLNTKRYIGKSKTYYGKTYIGYDGRLNQHINYALSESKKNDCPKFYNAIRKYGSINFSFSILYKK
jgi:hypothetical protein